MFGLFRTDSSGKKQHGITVLLVDMKTNGITVRPIRGYEGTHEVNQVFFDDVRVPAENRLGNENEGWAISKKILSYERFGSAEVARSIRALERLKRLAAETPSGNGFLLDNPDFLSRLTEIEIDLRALEITEQRMVAQPNMGAEASLLKIRGSEIQNTLFELTVDAVGLSSVYDVDEGSHSPAEPSEFREATRLFFNMRKTLIYSGSNEIQKNIIAKSVLGLR
jgi:alkylation response protein AidB-like acyl-CoA dehydrogenase